jgi:type I restriction enzyme R subunit
MSPEISERKSEEDIERALLQGGPDAYPAGAGAVADAGPVYTAEGPGGYRKRDWASDYDRARCLLPQDALDFVYATQPKEWKKYKTQYGDEAKEKFLVRLSREIERSGALDVLRKGIKDSGSHFKMAYFRPVSGLNEELLRLYGANLFGVVLLEVDGLTLPPMTPLL